MCSTDAKCQEEIYIQSLMLSIGTLFEVPTNMFST